MLTIVAAGLGAVFLFSEASLALRRRAASKAQDSGSLRLLWVVITASICIGVVLAARAVPPLLPAAVPWGVLGASVFLIGAALRWWSIAHLGRFFTVHVAVADDHRLIDTGPYRFIRHPSYTGLILQFIGLGLALRTLPALLMVLVPSLLAVLWRIRVEEAVLRAHLPGVYDAYEARTKKIVPLIF